MKIYINVYIVYIAVLEKKGASKLNTMISVYEHVFVHVYRVKVCDTLKWIRIHNIHFLIKRLKSKFYRYPKEKYIPNTALNYPTLVDMIGFQNANNKIVQKILDLVFNGWLKDGTKLNLEAHNQRYMYATIFQKLLNAYYYLDSII